MLISDRNYISIQGWMRTELNLKGNDLLVYAIIYGFSQTEEQQFTGSLQYLVDWCGASRQGILKNLKSLVDKGLIQKKEDIMTGKHSYRVGKHSLPNNIIDNKDTNNSKELFEKPKRQSQNLYTKCRAEIYNYTNKVKEQTLLETYLQLRLAIKDKPIYKVTQWKAILKKLDTITEENPKIKKSDIIEQSIEKGYASFYPVKKQRIRKIQDIEKLEVTHVDSYTKEELEELRKQDKRRAANGQRTKF